MTVGECTVLKVTYNPNPDNRNPYPKRSSLKQIKDAINLRCVCYFTVRLFPLKSRTLYSITPRQTPSAPTLNSTALFSVKPELRPVPLTLIYCDMVPCWGEASPLLNNLNVVISRTLFLKECCDGVYTRDLGSGVLQRDGPHRGRRRQRHRQQHRR